MELLRSTKYLQHFILKKNLFKQRLYFVKIQTQSHNMMLQNVVVFFIYQIMQVFSRMYILVKVSQLVVFVP